MAVDLIRKFYLVYDSYQEIKNAKKGKIYYDGFGKELVHNSNGFSLCRLNFH